MAVSQYSVINQNTFVEVVSNYIRGVPYYFFYTEPLVHRYEIIRESNKSVLFYPPTKTNALFSRSRCIFYHHCMIQFAQRLNFSFRSICMVFTAKFRQDELNWFIFMFFY